MSYIKLLGASMDQRYQWALENKRHVLDYPWTREQVEKFVRVEKEEYLKSAPRAHRDAFPHWMMDASQTLHFIADAWFRLGRSKGERYSQYSDDNARACMYKFWASARNFMDTLPKPDESSDEN